MCLGQATEGDNSATTNAEATQVPAGHSYHGEVFNEGPRQAALLLDGMGNVHFPVTTSSEQAQKFFDQGVAQLHGFWYFESERSFRQVAALDPDCAMAYWGMAMSNLGNETRARGFIAEAKKRAEKVTDRERRYINALAAYLEAKDAKNEERCDAYTRALERLLYDYPDDIEAKAFLVFHLWNARNAGLKIQSYLAVDALLDQVFAVNSMHPAHHYRIHLWDYERPERALVSSALCGPSLPGVAHMWHMPGHIYSRLKRYSDACYQQEASARVDHAHMMRYHILPDQIHNFAHNNEWLIRDLIHVGRVQDALDLAKNMIELPQHPRYNTLERSGCSASYGRQRLWDVLLTFELWDELLRLADTPYLEPSDILAEQIKRSRYMAVAHWQLGHVEQASAILEDLQRQVSEKVKARDEAVSRARQEALATDPDPAKADQKAEEARKPFEGDIRNLEQAIAELQVWQAATQNNWQEVLEKLPKAVGIAPMQAAFLRLRAGQTQEALKAARQHVSQHEQEVQPLAWLVYLLWQAGEREEAKKRFEELRVVAADSDRRGPLFERLATIARELGWPEDWRLPRPTPTDLGHRPPLEQLGPRCWQPPAAPLWSLPDADGQLHSLQDFSGKYVVVIFYLGHGCLHCVEQLRTFSPMASAFRQEGIELVAISNEGSTELAKAIANYGSEKLAFPLLSNAEMDVFKQYRCYDDFEGQPLHGTFLIDPQGRDVWHDIGFEPFMDAKFVLREALRRRQLHEHGAF